jgi:hypothetical protein
MQRECYCAAAFKTNQIAEADISPGPDCAPICSNIFGSILIIFIDIRKTVKYYYVRKIVLCCHLIVTKTKKKYPSKSVGMKETRGEILTAQSVPGESTAHFYQHADF